MAFVIRQYREFRGGIIFESNIIWIYSEMIFNNFLAVWVISLFFVLFIFSLFPFCFILVNIDII